MSVTVIQLTVGFIVAGVGVICGYTIHIQLTVGFSVTGVDQYFENSLYDKYFNSDNFTIKFF